MATTYTTHLNLNLPEIGAARDTWGALLNQNFSALDNFVSMAAPIGAIIDFGGPFPPAGWLVCDGRSISRVTYSDLFAVLAGSWGAGDGSTTFNLPNLIGRSGVGPGTVTDALGRVLTMSFTQKAGVVWNVIAQVNLPALALATDAGGLHSHGVSTAGAGAHGHYTDYQGLHSHGGGVSGDGNHQHGGTTDSQGDHNHTVTLPAGAGVTAGGLGGVAGAGTNGYISSVNGAHQHNITTDFAGFHGHGISADGSHAHNISNVGDHAHGIYADGYHAHNVYLGGSSTPLLTQSPVLVVTKIIYAGKQAAPFSATASASTAAAGDEVAALREEVAALRALFETPRERLLRAPSRGAH